MSTVPVPLVFGDYALEDRYRLDKGRVYLTGIQALVRLPMMQRQRDLAAGLNTGGFISGYRGSPLGMYDNALWTAKRYLKENNIHFQPGLNEDLAATSVWGTQQVNLFPGATVDGVFSIWYGKGPGVDRSMDVLKHGNAAGTSPHGGVIALAGDDHGCQSSTLPHQSEQVFAAAMIPVVNPANVQEYLDFGMLGFALSRYSGCWIGFKAISETVESGASVWVDPERIKIMMPTDFQLPPGGLGIRNPDAPLDAEKRLHGPKMAAVKAFVRANGFDKMVIDPPQARIGIMTTGKAYLDTRQALEDLGIDEARARALGIRLYKVGMTWPLEPEGARRFAEGLQEVIVVEEKRSNLEDQLVHILYNAPADRRPLVIGKSDETGRIILPSEGELTPTGVAMVIAARLMKHGGESQELRQRLARLESKEKLLAAPPPKVSRTPYFCSGCPHNTSTRVPEGSRAMAGIGCHGMAIWMPERRTSLISHMGGEGVSWIGQAPFSADKHIFQNLGDGTYYHSGLMAIRQAAAAGVNITYKILFNDAVAMTGGQPHDGPLNVPDITKQVAAEGAKKVVVVTDEPDKYPLNADFAHGVTHPPSRRARCRAARAARDPRSHRAGLRPDLRRREAPAPQARHLPRSGQARVHQRRGVRGLRRLLRQEQLRVGEAARDRARPQAPDRPEQLQQGLLLRERLLPELRVGAWRRRPQGHTPAAQGRAGRSLRRAADAHPAAALRGLRHPGHRHRRHRRDHRRRADRHGGPSRRQGLHRARLHGPCPEERRRDEPCAPRAEARGPARRAHRRRRRQPGAGLRHGRGRLAGRAVAHRAGRHQGRHQRPRPAGGGVRHERRHGSRRRGDDEVDPRCRGRGGRLLRRRHGPRHGDPGRFDRHQPLHAGLCLAEGPAAAVVRGHRARHRAQRRGGRDQQADLRLGPAGRPQPRRRAGRRQADAAGREAGGAHACRRSSPSGSSC